MFFAVHVFTSLPYFQNLTNSPFCNGLAGLMSAYHTALQSVQLYGPTNFSPVINHVAKYDSRMGCPKLLIYN